MYTIIDFDQFGFLSDFRPFRIFFHIALRSPLMAVNITISGITAIGALHLMGGGYYPTNIIEGLSAVTALISFVNVFGGFVAVQRMLDVYRRPNDPPGINLKMEKFFLWKFQKS